ncbi:MAG: DinB family protein [Planctomycetaceae bacterium]
MTYAEQILPEFDAEMASTRKVLERIPEDKLDWKPHPKSNTIGWNANHLAEIPGWVEGTLTHLSWDMAPVGGEPYQSPKLASRKAILDLFDRNVASARESLASVKESELAKVWSLLSAGKPIISMPRAAVIRGFVLNHLIHHRAILCVYLRMNNIAVPGMYGPSGDEKGT